MPTLTEDDLTRYQRQMLLPGWGEAGQEKLKSARAFIAGAGGLGSPAAVYLAAAGVGELRICDADVVELSNLNRQILHPEERIGVSKAISAGKTLRAQNAAICIQVFPERLDESSIERVAGSPDIVLDCLDNYETRYLLNRYCLAQHIPLVHAAVWGFTGQLSFLHPPETPCLRCIVPSPPPTSVFPIVGAIAGLVGCLQAAEALKHLAGVGSALRNTLLVVDAEEMEFFRLQATRRPECPDCGG
jgi:adenylyltransferase/sulfurtransferase